MISLSPVQPVVTLTAARTPMVSLEDVTRPPACTLTYSTWAEHLPPGDYFTFDDGQVVLFDDGTAVEPG